MNYDPSALSPLVRRKARAGPSYAYGHFRATAIGCSFTPMRPLSWRDHFVRASGYAQLVRVVAAGVDGEARVKLFPDRASRGFFQIAQVVDAEISQGMDKLSAELNRR